MSVSRPGETTSKSKYLSNHGLDKLDHRGPASHGLDTLDHRGPASHGLDKLDHRAAAERNTA